MFLRCFPRFQVVLRIFISIEMRVDERSLESRAKIKNCALRARSLFSFGASSLSIEIACDKGRFGTNNHHTHVFPTAFLWSVGFGSVLRQTTREPFCDHGFPFTVVGQQAHNTLCGSSRRATGRVSSSAFWVGPCTRPGKNFPFPCLV